jgi:hypothetical protein
MGRHYSLLGKAADFNAAGDGAARPDPDGPRTAAFQCSTSARRRIDVVLGGSADSIVSCDAHAADATLSVALGASPAAFMESRQSPGRALGLVLEETSKFRPRRDPSRLDQRAEFVALVFHGTESEAQR